MSPRLPVDPTASHRTGAGNSAVPVEHYENFPVASWLCPRPLRPAVAALYHFARTADDLADEGPASADQRLADLAAYGEDLRACAAGRAVSPRWAWVFGPLAAAIDRHALPLTPLEDLLSAFTQDVARTRDGQGYASRDELLDYCRRSANPVGRLMLHLFGVHEAHALRESDAICTALQLANFWQDLSVDLARGRFYLPAADCMAHGLQPVRSLDAVADPGPQERARALVADLCAWTRETMARGAPLVHRVPGRAGWELRAVVQGGLRILDRIEAQGFDTFSQRPVVGRRDLPLIAWRCLVMGALPGRH